MGGGFRPFLGVFLAVIIPISMGWAQLLRTQPFFSDGFRPFLSVFLAVRTAISNGLDPPTQRGIGS